MSKLNLTILGDICPTPDTLSYFESNDAKGLLGDVLSEIKTADFSLCNVEFPLIEKGKPAIKTGPILSGKVAYSELFKDAGFNLVSLGNNHIKDYGERGVLSTLKAFEDIGIPTLGAGENIQKAKKPYITEVNGIKLGVLTYAEQEFNTANALEAGASYLDPYEDLEQITNIKKQVDFLIILYHGGIEYYEHPSPELQKKCRKMIASGADFVTCQHSHCIGTFEAYQGGEILYGQGNSVFGYRKNKESWNEGLLVELALTKKNNSVSVVRNFRVIRAESNGNIGFATEEQSIKVLDELKERSSRIIDAEYVSSEWAKFCSKQSNLVLPQLLGYNRLLIHLNRITKGKLIDLLFGRRNRMVTQNMIRCEAHKEVVQTILNNRE